MNAIFRRISFFKRVTLARVLLGVSLLVNVFLIAILFFVFHAIFAPAQPQQQRVSLRPFPMLDSTPIELAPIDKKDLLPELEKRYGSFLPTRLQDGAYEKYGPAVGGYLLSRDEYVVLEKHFDVDKDGTDEMILEVAPWGGNHPSMRAYIIKDNKTIILTAILGGGESGIDPADGDGFILRLMDWGENGVVSVTRYRVVDYFGHFFPVWVEGDVVTGVEVEGVVR